MPRLKVFQTQIGFFDTVVAVSSQQAALRAWGVRQNLFAGGDAFLAKDQAAITAALGNPGIVLRRAAGSEDPFAVEPGNLPAVPKQQKSRVSSPAKLPAKMRKPAADRSSLDRAETALADLDAQWRQQEASLEKEQHALDERRSAAAEKHVQDREAAETTVAKAREGYRKAGGLK